LDANKAMGARTEKSKEDEPPLELEMRNRHVQTTETMVRNWVMYTKLLIQRIGRPQTHKLVNMAGDETRLEPNEDGDLVANPVSSYERDYQETEDHIVDLVIPEDDKLTHSNKVFFKDG